MAEKTVERSEDGRWIVVGGRRWRAEDPALDPGVAGQLRSHLGRARSAVRTATDDETRRSARDRVQLAKEGLGERGTAWWELPAADRARRASERLSRLDELAPSISPDPEPPSQAGRTG
ncbi:biopolymer transporter Tol [Ruania suaedae]|uniref:biopolymer transporter Tol n=1 Tax=Ruania suaedae TaxID=2897774 RepID=UPI001E395CC4|nr:biopolymer transporter Tol [Ruania suaedae]UFU02304.1 biopolymer transporter Tol [Ruania suaedae]